MKSHEQGRGGIDGSSGSQPFDIVTLCSHIQSSHLRITGSIYKQKKKEFLQSFSKLKTVLGLSHSCAQSLGAHRLQCGHT